MATDLGTDVSTPTGFDLDPMFGLVSGRTCLAQALVRRLVTPRGTLLDDPGYGSDLRSRVNDHLDASGLGAISAAVKAEIEADERVDRATATAALSGARLTVTARVESSDGPFTLVLGVSSVTVNLLRVESA